MLVYQRARGCVYVDTYYIYIYIDMVSILLYIRIYWYDGISNQEYDLQTKLVMCTDSDDMMVYD